MGSPFSARLVSNLRYFGRPPYAPLFYTYSQFSFVEGLFDVFVAFVESLSAVKVYFGASLLQSDIFYKTPY